MCPPTLGDHCPTKTPRGATTRRVVRLVYWLVVHPEHSGVPWHPPRVPQGLARLASHSLLFILNLFPMKAWGERCVPQNQGIFTENPTVAKGQCLGQGFQPTFRGHCSWGAGEQEGAPCLDRLMHVVPLGELVCQCMSCSTHGGCAAVGRHACAPRVRVHAPSVLSCFVLSLHMHHTPCASTAHTLLHAHCRLHACPVPALQVHSEHALLALCTLSTHTKHALCALCKPCTHPLLTLFAQICVHVHSTCSMHTLLTLGTHTQRWQAHKGHAGSVDTLHTPSTLWAHCVHSYLHAPPVFSPWAPHALCILCVHPCCTPSCLPPLCTAHCPPARPMHACSVQRSMHLWHTLSVH